MKLNDEPLHPPIHCRLLWRRLERHHRVRRVLHAREQSTKLQIHHGQFIQVSVYGKPPWPGVHVIGDANANANGRFLPQVRHRHAGAAGGRELHDRVFERSHVAQEDAHGGLAQEVLPTDRQEVRGTDPTPQNWTVFISNGMLE